MISRAGGLIAAALLASTATLADELPLAIQLTRQILPKTTAAIADVGAPRSVRLNKGDFLAKIIAQMCGTLDPIYTSILLSRNNGLTANDLQSVRQDTVVSLPACALSPEVRPAAGYEFIVSTKTTATAAPAVADGVTDVVGNLKQTLDTIRQFGSDSAQTLLSLGQYYERLNNHAYGIASRGSDGPWRSPSQVSMELIPVWSTVDLPPTINRAAAKARIQAALSEDSGNSDIWKNPDTWKYSDIWKNPDIWKHYDTGKNSDTWNYDTWKNSDIWKNPNTWNYDTWKNSDIWKNPDTWKYYDTGKNSDIWKSPDTWNYDAWKYDAWKYSDIWKNPDTWKYYDTGRNYFTTLACADCDTAPLPTTGGASLWSAPGDTYHFGQAFGAPPQAAAPVSPANSVGEVKDAVLASLIPDINETEPAMVGDCDNIETNNPWQWPFDLGLMLQVLALERDPRNPAPQAAGVLVIDTGIDDLAAHSFAFGSGDIRLLRYLPDLDNPQRRDDTLTLGVNAASHKNSPQTPDEYEDRFHGLMVAEAALGSTQTQWLRRLFPSLVQVSFVSVLGPAGSSYRITAVDIAHGLEVASQNSIHIVNLSLTLSAWATEVEDELRKIGSSVLVIVAAGNAYGTENDLDNSKRWPAMYGGEPNHGPGSAIVVTVGAHDGKGMITPFSGRSKQRVDLLAPGCHVPDYTASVLNNRLTVKPKMTNGTSFAAPLVAYVAGLLNSRGLDPPAIKARLIVSVDPKPTLESLVWSYGILNPWKALALHHDVVVDDNESPKTRTTIGTMQPGKQSVKLCGKTALKVSQIMKLALTPEADVFKVRGWTKSEAGLNDTDINRFECTTQPGDELDTPLTVENAATGELVKVPVRSVRDWVRPYYTPPS